MDRFDGPGAFMAQAREEGPGPGAYYSVEDEVSVDGTSVLAQNGVAAFGTTARRFGPKAASASPGPQAYNLQDFPSLTVDASVSKRVRSLMPDSVFQSTNVRFPERAAGEGPEPGAYNPIPVKGSQPRIRPSGEGFWVQEERFRASAAAEDNRDFVTIPSSMGTAGATFTGTGRDDKWASETDAPPPGSYDIQMKWTKKSYNQLFQAPAEP